MNRIELLLGAVFLAACNGAAAVTADAGPVVDAARDDSAAEDAGTDAIEAPTDSGVSDALSEIAAAYCAPYLDASDPATVCTMKNCCAQIFTCQFSQPCNDYDGCIVLTPWDAAPPDAAADPGQWIIDYCTQQYPEGGAQSIAVTDCAAILCGDSGLGH